MAKKTGRPSWFKLDVSLRPLIDAVPDENVGRALKVILNYFEMGDVTDVLMLDPFTLAVFSALKPFADESFSDYERSRENGRRGGRPAAQREEKGGVTPPNPPLPTLTDKEREKEREEDKDKDKDSFFTEREEALSDLGAGATDLTDFSSYFESVDSIAIRKERCEAIGGGAVQLSDEQMQELFSKLSLTDFEYYVGVIRKCIDKGHTYRRKSHCQAILDMAAKDGKLKHEVSGGGSFDTDEFFAAAVRKSYEK